MPVTNYYAVNGDLIGEAVAGVRTDYVTDALGSVTATADSGGSFLNTYTYKPFGEKFANSSNKAPDPKFLWNGGVGYRQTGLAGSPIYVRSRHYDTESGRWTTEDIFSGVLLASGIAIGVGTTAIPPSLLAMYRYAGTNPTTWNDPTGLKEKRSVSEVGVGGSGTSGSGVSGACVTLKVHFILWEVLEVEITGTACLHCYDNSCCKGEAAPSCLTITVEVGLGVNINIGELLAELIEDIAEIISGLENLKKEINTIAAMINGAVCTINPPKGCPKREIETEFKICLSICCCFLTAEGCLGAHGGCIQGCTGGCFLPKIELKAEYKWTNCSGEPKPKE